MKNKCGGLLRLFDLVVYFPNETQFCLLRLEIAGCNPRRHTPFFFGDTVHIDPLMSITDANRTYSLSVLQIAVMLKFIGPYTALTYTGVVVLPLIE